MIKTEREKKLEEQLVVAMTALKAIWKECIPTPPGHFKRGAAKKALELSCEAVGRVEGMDLVLVLSDSKSN